MIEFYIASSFVLFVLAACGASAYAVCGAKGIAPLKFKPSDYFLFLFLTSVTLLAALGVAQLVRELVFTPNEWSMFLPSVFMQIFTIASVVVFGKFGTFGVLDLFKKFTLADILCGVKFFFLSLAVVPFAMVFSYLTIKTVQGVPPARQEIIDIFSSTTDPFAIALALLSITILAPISEELFFRGVLYRILRDGLFCGGIFERLSVHVRAIASAILVSAIFSYIHFSLYAALPLFVMGMLFVACYAKRGNIVSAIVMHSLFNIANVSIIFLTYANENI